VEKVLKASFFIILNFNNIMWVINFSSYVNDTANALTNT